jgi:hypothetical protein
VRASSARAWRAGRRAGLGRARPNAARPTLGHTAVGRFLETRICGAGARARGTRIGGTGVLGHAVVRRARPGEAQARCDRCAQARGGRGGRVSERAGRAGDSRAEEAGSRLPRGPKGGCSGTRTRRARALARSGGPGMRAGVGVRARRRGPACPPGAQPGAGATSDRVTSFTRFGATPFYALISCWMVLTATCHLTSVTVDPSDTDSLPSLLSPHPSPGDCAGTINHYTAVAVSMRSSAERHTIAETGHDKKNYAVR